MNRQSVSQTLQSSPAITPVVSGILQRQCACGNHTMAGGECEECKKNKQVGLPLQAKLTISQPGDQYEQEADRVAEQVMRMPSGRISSVSQSPVHIQRMCAACASGKGLCPKCAEEKKQQLQRKEANGSEALEIPATVHEVIGTSGQPLDAATRDFMESRFGHDFSHVRVHTDKRAAESASAINALAYTVGSNVVFGSGRYAPDAIIGQRLLAHELAHVIQQSKNFGGFERIQRWQFEPDPRAALAARNAYGMKNQSEPGIWFDDWDDDERDNDLDGVIDNPVERGADGIHIECREQGKAKCQAGIYDALICSNSPERRTDDPSCSSKQHHRVKYRVCIDLPRESYYAAGLFSFPGIRDVGEVMRQLSGKRDWKVFYSGENRLDGDFVANGQHSGIAYQGEIIHLSGQTGRRQHYGSVLPSRRNDIEMTSNLWHGGINFRARPVKERRGKGGMKTACVPIDSPPILSSLVTLSTSNRNEESKNGNRFEPATQSALLGSDLVGLMLNDGINFGTWNRRPRVEQLQQKLIENGAALNIDGMFGEDTSIALQEFQGNVGLPQQSSVDEATAAYLEGYTPGSDEIPPSSQLEGLRLNDGLDYGTWDLRPRVANLQQRLTAFGFSCKVDGMFGHKTLASLNGFQTANGLIETEEVNRSTADALEGRSGGGGDMVCPTGEIPIPIEV